ncbi:MAG: aminopeptidase P N-terminal domain-containing protein [Candidatus Saccharimonadales bacterium]
MLSTDFFIGNRRRLFEKLEPRSFVVITAFGEMQRGVDSSFKFEQEANFWYLTGIDAADWRLVIDVDTGHEWLIMPEIGEVRQIFDGSISAKEATISSGMKDILDPKQGDELLHKLLTTKQRAYTLKPLATDHYGFYANPAPRKLRLQLRGAKEVGDIRLALAKMRAIKQPAEIEAIQRAIDVTVHGFEHTLPLINEVEYEYQIEAELSHHFRNLGADGHAYDPIVAAGKNACTLHYIQNNAPLQGKKWLLIDAGARLGGYCADITRSLPINTPTERETNIYEAVKRVHDLAVSLCKPGQSTKEYMEQTEAAMGEELVQLGLIKKASSQKELRSYFPHSISHGLGIDVHDPLGHPELFEEGMVLTVEPGIYIPDEAIGIRLENDIVITKDGPKNLSGQLPSDLASLMKMVY